MRIKFTYTQSFWLYFILLLLIYHYKVKDYFYWNIVANKVGEEFDLSILRLLIAMLIFSVNLGMLTLLNKQKLLFAVISFFFLLLTIPSLVTFTSGEVYSIRLLLYHQLFFFSLWSVSRFKFTFDKFPQLNKTQSLYVLISVTTVGVMPYLFVYGPYINLNNLFLVDVYETRAKMGNLSNAYFGYTYSVFADIVIPLIIVISLELKNRLTLFYGIGMLVLFYLFGAHKSVYAGLLVILIFYKFSFFSSVKKMVYLFNGLIICCLLLILFFNNDYLWILTIRRVQFIPSLLDICYIDFFKDRPLIWSESILKIFIEYPYNFNHKQLIGENYFYNPEMNANNGIISDGFMNLGTMGVLINIIMVSVYFMFLNSLKISSRYTGLFFLTTLSFISSSTTTVFLTHGGLALLIISIFILNRKSKT